MKLDTKQLRYLSAEDWRVLTGVEVGSKNHEIIPTPLIIQLANLRSGSGVHKCISTLAKANLIARVQNAKYDGYRLTYGGLDYLALHAHLKHSVLYSVGPCIGTGKESDVYVCAPPPSSSSSSNSAPPRQVVLKIHRLGRISFRTVKNNRDYLRHRQSASWMYMSRLAAQKEHAFMRALGQRGFRVPEAIAWNRHTVVMSLIEDSIPLRAVKQVGDPIALYAELMETILRLAEHGLIHGDFNEFNILIREEALAPESETTPGEEVKTAVPYIIDFPQAVSIEHPDAAVYFARDVDCIKKFFARRFHFTSDEPGPLFEDARKRASRRTAAGGADNRLDVEVEASGFSRKLAKELEKYMAEIGASGIEDEEVDGEDDDDKEADEVGGEEDKESAALLAAADSLSLSPGASGREAKADDEDEPGKSDLRGVSNPS